MIRPLQAVNLVHQQMAGDARADEAGGLKKSSRGSCTIN